MRRILVLIVALAMILCAGSVTVGAEDSSGDSAEQTVLLLIQCWLTDDAPTYSEMSQRITNMPTLESAYIRSTIEVNVEGSRTMYPLEFENGKGLLKCELTFKNGVSDIEVKFVSSSFTDADGKKLLVFEKIEKIIKLTADSVEYQAEIEHGWSNELMRHYEMSAQGDSTEESGNIVSSLLSKLKDFSSQITSAGIMIMSDDLFSSDELNGIIDKIYNIIYPIAFLLMCAIWLVGIGKNGITMELWQKESYIKPLLRLFWGIAMMAVCMPLLELIFSLFHGITLQAFDSNIQVGAGSSFDSLEKESEKWISDSWIVGGIMTFINVIINIPTILVNSGFDMLFAVVFYIVVAMRFIKLAVLQCMSPFFFACSVSDKTEKYMQSFLREYIILAAQILVAMSMYAVLNSIFNALFSLQGGLSAIFNLIMYIAGIIAVAGSGKFMRNLMT